MYDKISLKADFYDRYLSSKSKNYGIELMKSLQWPAGFVESVEGPVDRLLYSSKNGEKNLNHSNNLEISSPSCFESFQGPRSHDV